MRAFAAPDEQVHPADPGDWSWNESWFFSWIDLDGGPAGFFRLGLLPNQRRAMLWSFVHVDGRWLGIEESRLAHDDVEVDDGVAYDRWGLGFAWRPDPPLEGARFTFAGSFLERSGTESGAYVVGRSFPGTGGGFLRIGDAPVEHLVTLADSRLVHDDAGHTFTAGRLHLQGEASDLTVDLKPLSPAVTFDVAHTCRVPERWLYYRMLVEAEVSGWDRPCRGWFETSRYGA